jgi:hypothetical protein
MRWSGVVRLALLSAATIGTGQLGRAAEPPVQANVTPLSITQIGKNTFMVRDPLIMTFKDGAPAVTVPAGFVTELGSVPKRLQWWDGKTESSIAPAVFHDYLYWTQACTRDEADAVMHVAMTALGVGNAKAVQTYKAVSSTGSSAFKSNGERRRSGEARTFTPEYVRAVVQQPFDLNETLATALRKAQAASGLATHDAPSEAVKLTCARLLYQCEACRQQVAKKDPIAKRKR